MKAAKPRKPSSLRSVGFSVTQALRAGRSLSLATLVIALSGYAIIVIAGHTLTPADFEQFAVYWGLFFACTGILDGLLQETTRAVTAAGITRAVTAPATPNTSVAQSPTRPATLSLWFSLGVATLALATAPLWAPPLIPSAIGPGVLFLAVGLASYAIQATVGGVLLAQRRWRSYSWMISLDSAIRLGLAGAAWALHWHLTAFFLVTVIGAFTWCGLLLVDLPRTRVVRTAIADVPRRQFLRQAGAAMVASGANSLLIAGFPMLLMLTSDRSIGPGALAAIVTAVTLSRAPLLVPLQRLIPALIVPLTGRRTHSMFTIGKAAIWCLATAAVGGLLAWRWAVPVVSWFLPAELVSDAETYGVLTLASSALAILMVTGAATLGQRHHAAYVLGWLIATIVAIALLLTDFSPTVRSALALGIAPLIGVLVHLWSLTTQRDRRAASALELSEDFSSRTQ